MIEQGQASINGKNLQLTESGNVFKTIGIGLIQVLGGIPQAVNVFLSLVVQPYYTNNSNNSEFQWFSIQDLIYGKIGLFDINFFKIQNNSSGDNINTTIKTQVSQWYYVVRNIAMIGSLLALVYVGIRMAISTVASDQAKYKQMLLMWLKSFVVLFVLPYIFIFIFSIGDAFIDIVKQVAPKENLDTIILEALYGDMNKNDITASFWAFINLCMLTYFNVKFFGRYLFRLLKIAFLIIISPLITVTYALGKDSAYKAWLGSLIGAIFMQVVHIVVYSIFMFSTAEIVKAVPILMIAFFMAMEKGERIFNYVFGLEEQE